MQLLCALLVGYTTAAKTVPGERAKFERIEPAESAGTVCGLGTNSGRPRLCGHGASVIAWHRTVDGALRLIETEGKVGGALDAQLHAREAGAACGSVELLAHVDNGLAPGHPRDGISPR